MLEKWHPELCGSCSIVLIVAMYDLFQEGDTLVGRDDAGCRQDIGMYSCFYGNHILLLPDEIIYSHKEHWFKLILFNRKGVFTMIDFSFFMALNGEKWQQI